MSIMRTSYRELTVLEEKLIRDIKLNAEHLYNLIPDKWGVNGGANAEFSIARERIQEAVMWAVKGITG